MGTKKARQFCPEEKRLVLGEKQTPNHMLHLLLSVVTGGAWLGVWLLIAMFGGGRYRCPSCGALTRGYTTRKDRREMERAGSL